MRTIDHITQHGPTCGIYAIAMIINALYNGMINGQKLAYEIFDKAINNGISEIGELFHVDDVIGLLDVIVKEKLLLGIEKLDYKIVCFDDLNDMRQKVKTAFDNGKYVMVAYYSNCGRICVRKRKIDFRHAHWAVLYDLDESDRISGEQGQRRASKKAVLIKKPLEELFRSNYLLEGTFYWDKYFGRFSFLKRLDYMIFRKPNKAISEKLIGLFSRKNIRELRGKYKKLNLKGKIIVIGVSSN